MQMTAQGWLVLELTDSEFLLGAVSAAQMAPVLLFTLYAGVVADRADKRRIMIVANASAVAFALALATLTATGRVTVGWVAALVFGIGTASAFEIPTRQSFFAELVGRRDLSSAIALNSAAFNATRVVGPAVAGALIAGAGVAVCFFANAASYFAAVAGLIAIRRPAFRAPERKSPPLEQFREGLAYIRGHRLTAALVGLTAAMSVTVFPFTMLLPVFARDVLGAGATGLGWLLSASGAGALVGGVALAARGGARRQGRFLLVTAALFSLLIGGFAASRSLPLSMALLAAGGCAMILTTATVNSLIQAVVPDHLRGRVMSVYVFMFLGMMPVGSLVAGALARVLGAPAAVELGAAALLVVLAWVAARVPEVRRAR